MFNFFETVFTTLDRHDNHVVIMAVYFCLFALVVFLRIGSHLHFRGAVFAVLTEVRKGIKNRDELSGIKNRLLRKATVEYIRVADRAVTSIPTEHIAERAVSSMSFLGWKYDGLLPFIEAMETAFLWLGIVLALIFSQYAFVYGLSAIIIFVLARIFAAFFHVRGARAELIGEIVLFIEREVGRFFASDSGGAILRLKNDLTEAIDRQAATYKATMETIGRTMADTMTEVTGSMISAANSIGPIVASAMDEKLINMNTQLTATLNEWEKALKESANIQNGMNTSAERLTFAGGQLQAAAELLATHMKGHSGALSEQLITLVSSIDMVKDSIESLTEQQQMLKKQAAYIETNQHNLEISIASYEASLQNLTRSLGDGLGAYVSLHAEASAQAISDSVKANIDKIIHLLSSNAK